MPKGHTHDDYVEIELTRGTSRMQAALKGLETRQRQQVMRAVEVCISEAVDQTLDWANDHFEEYEGDLRAAASGILTAMAKADDDPGVLGRVMAAFLIAGIRPDVEEALKARRAAHGLKGEATLADHLARVGRTFGVKGGSRKAATKRGGTSRRPTAKAAKR